MYLCVSIVIECVEGLQVSVAPTAYRDMDSLEDLEALWGGRGGGRAGSLQVDYNFQSSAMV